MPGTREKNKGFLEGKPSNSREPLLPRFALLTDDLLIVNIPINCETRQWSGGK